MPRVRGWPFSRLVAALVLVFRPPSLASPRHGEKSLEQGVEQGEIALRLDQHRTQAETQQLAIVQSDTPNALQGFEALGYGNSQPLIAQQAHEAEKTRRHRFTSCNTRAMSSLSFNKMLSVLTMSWRDKTLAPSTTRARAQSRVSLMLGRFAQLEFPHALDELHDVRGQMMVDAGHLAVHDLQFDVKGRLVDVEVKTAPLEGLREAAGGVAGE